MGYNNYETCACRQTTTTSYKSRICFWDRKKKKEGEGDTPDVIERKHRLVVPNHLVPFGPKARPLLFLAVAFCVRVVDPDPDSDLHGSALVIVAGSESGSRRAKNDPQYRKK